MLQVTVCYVCDYIISQLFKKNNRVICALCENVSNNMSLAVRDINTALLAVLFRQVCDSEMYLYGQIEPQHQAIQKYFCNYVIFLLYDTNTTLK